MYTPGGFEINYDFMSNPGFYFSQRRMKPFDNVFMVVLIKSSRSSSSCGSDDLVRDICDLKTTSCFIAQIS